MRAVAKRRILAVLASAEIGGSADRRGVRLGSERRSCVAPIAVWLIGALSACAPIDRFTTFKFSRDGGFLSYFRFHRITPMRDGLPFAQLVTKHDSFIAIEQNAVF